MTGAARLQLLFLLVLSLALAGCSIGANTEQIPPVETPQATFGASPNPIVVSDGTDLGVTTLTWTATKAKAVEIHVTSPSGALMAAGTAKGSAETGKWVRDGMAFYLLDANAANKADPAATLAVIKVKVIKP
jgi:hypothetical protein